METDWIFARIRLTSSIETESRLQKSGRTAEIRLARDTSVRKANSCEHASSRSRERVRRTRNRIVLMPFKLIELENEPM